MSRAVQGKMIGRERSGIDLDIDLCSRSVAEPAQVRRRSCGANFATPMRLAGPSQCAKPPSPSCHSPCPSDFVDPAGIAFLDQLRLRRAIVQFGSHPIGNWNRSNVACLADQISNAFAKVLGPAPQSANCRGALTTSSASNTANTSRAKSALRRPQSAASDASRRTAPRRRLTVPSAS